MPQLDIDFFFSSFCWIFIFFIFVFIFVVFFFISKIFKVFFLRKFLISFYKIKLTRTKRLLDFKKFRINLSIKYLLNNW